MCGIQITKRDVPNGVTHRGVQNFEENIHSWYIKFSSLPISSGKTDLTQPIKINDTYLVFNGEIFNYNQFGRYKSDLHYLKDLFEKGLEKNKRFQKEYKMWDGFWSICIIDETGITFFTDPLGKKQLYFSNQGICSELKPLIYRNRIMPFPKMGTINTCFQDIYRALPGQFYRYDREDRMAFRDRTFANNYLKRIEPVKKGVVDYKNIVKLINKSVKDRAVINYGKLGLLFSGGLDSSIMAYHLVKNNIPFQAISIENDEKENAERIAKYLGFNINYIDNRLSEEDYKNAILAYEHSLDYGSLMPQYKLFKKAKELGINTVITGDGADELFSGYTRAQIKDTQQYDVFKELPYFHHIRIDRMSMTHTIECRNPFLSTDIILYALSLKYDERKNKNILRKAYKDLIPFVDVKKKPLRLNNDKEYNKNNINNKFNKYYGDFTTN